jgi:hypothetical protein
MMPSSVDCWNLRRVLANQPLDGHVAAMSAPWKAVVERLASLAPEARGSEFATIIGVRDDRDRIIDAVTAANPKGSPDPAADAEPDDGWGPIRLGMLPSVEPFPLDVLPLPARHLAEAAAESIGCPGDFPAVAILAAASGIIGRSVSLLIKPGYFASASLYVGLVGNSSSGKSPALRAALAPVWSISHSLYETWRPQMDTWKAAKPDQRGPEPTLERIASTDPTTEALGPILAKNPRGLIVAPDEMTKWVLSMDQYKGGKGGDRPFYLTAWCGESVIVDRAKHMTEPIVVPHPFLTVAGGLTPDMLSTLPEGQGRDDGFMVHPDSARAGRGYRARRRVVVCNVVHWGRDQTPPPSLLLLLHVPQRTVRISSTVSCARFPRMSRFYGQTAVLVS